MVSWPRSARLYAPAYAPTPQRTAVRRCPVPATAKTMFWLTMAGLILVTAYSVTIGSDGWLWFTWVVLGLMTIGTLAARRT